MIDTVIKLRGSAAKEFNKMMTSVDIDSLHARDKFISNLNYDVDENGILLIDISDLDIDLSVIQNEFQQSKWGKYMVGTLKEIAENYEKLHRLEMINTILRMTSEYVSDVVERVRDDFDDCEEFENYITESVIKHIKENFEVLEKYIK